MVRLSVVIITLNEQHNIGRCLSSVSKVADEIVVVDSGSTDGTEKICADAGAKFIYHPFEGHIEQKNFALSQAGSDYILALDADEALSEKLISSILEVKINWEKDCYQFNRLTNYCGKWIRHGSWYPDKKFRLFRRTKSRWGGQNPHDHLVMDSDATTGYLTGDLLHYSYYSIADHINQVNIFSTIGAQSAFDAGRKAGILLILFSPVFKFIRDYFLLLGFLDGYYGFIICRISAHATFLKYAKLRELITNNFWLCGTTDKSDL
jgi:glycosyltransferase involved in cell wall biosynthesis